MRRTLTWVLLAAIVGILAYASTLRATPSSGFTGTTLAAARFDEIDVRNRYPTHHPSWHATLRTQGDSDVFVQSNVWAPGGSTGWHTHPGPSLILVTAGTISAYEGNGRSCGTCHRPSDGMSVSAAHIQERLLTLGRDPIFRTVEGSNCNHSVDVSTLAGRKAANLT